MHIAWSRFGGFLLRRGRPVCTEMHTGAYFPSTGHDGMPCRQYVHGGIHIGVRRVAAVDTFKPGLRGAVL